MYKIEANFIYMYPTLVGRLIHFHYILYTVHVTGNARGSPCFKKRNLGLERKTEATESVFSILISSGN
jgi:hypothetical protein